MGTRDYYLRKKKEVETKANINQGSFIKWPLMRPIKDLQQLQFSSGNPTLQMLMRGFRKYPQKKISESS